MNTQYTKVLLASLLFGLSAVAQSAVVTFSDITDGNGTSAYFDPATTTPDGGDGNVLNIGLDSFLADGSSGATTSAVDTISMVITAPDGYVITSVTYSETGTVETTNGVATASGSIVADGIPSNFLTVIAAPGTAVGGWGIDAGPVAIANKQSIAVSITNSLFAFSFSPQEIALIEKTDATLTVEIAEVPLPAAAWLFGSALIALVSIQRRKA